MTNQEEMEKALKQRDEADYQCFNMLVELADDYVHTVQKSSAFISFINRVNEHIKVRRQADADFIKYHRAAVLDDQLAAARGSY